MLTICVIITLLMFVHSTAIVAELSEHDREMNSLKEGSGEYDFWKAKSDKLLKKGLICVSSGLFMTFFSIAIA